MSVYVSIKAAKKVQEGLEREQIPHGGLRLGVKGGGCSGMTYDLDITGEQLDSDKVVEQHGIKVLVDKKSYIFLVGTVLDFSDGLNGKGFHFENPNAKKACGCGTSFSV